MTNKSTRRRNAVISAVAGAALLVGGSTYALWSANDTIKGGTITGGDLAIAVGDMQAWDVSEDRTDNNTGGVTAADGTTVLQGLKGHAIKDLEPEREGAPYWKMVPGDTVAMTFPYVVTLEGDNLVAGLEIKGDLSDVIKATEKIPTKDPDGGDAVVLKSVISLRYQIFDQDGVALTETPQPVGNIKEGFTVSYFQDSGVGQDHGKPEGQIENNPKIPVVGANGTAIITFVLFVDFSSDAKGAKGPDMEKGQDMGQNLITLGETLTATLQQVRCIPEADVANNFNELSCK